MNNLWRMNFWFPVKVENYVIELLLAFQERLFSGVRQLLKTDVCIFLSGSKILFFSNFIQ